MQFRIFREQARRFSAAVAVVLAAIGIGSLEAQVVNFDVPGGAGAANYSGQGAYSDPGHNYWNPVFGGGTTPATNRLSDGVTPTPITLTSQLGGTFGTQGTQGTAGALQSPYEYNNAVLRTDSLNNVPPGTYNLYLYGINNTGTRGTTFTVFTSATAPVTESTSNTPASLTSFIQGADYVIFSNVVVPVTGNIAFTWTANPNVALAGNNEGDFSGVQLVLVSTNTVVSNAAPNFGPNVFTFSPSMSMATIQLQVSNVFSQQQNNQFGSSRYAFLFNPGQYSNLDVDLGYYTQVIGLGQMPDDVTITGDVHSDGVLANDNATVNFWRGCENFAVVPTNAGSSQLEAANTMTFAVSQDTWLRRMHIHGNLNLANTENGAYSSGGFLADSKIDSTVSSITQQQWLSRNDIWQHLVRTGLEHGFRGRFQSTVRLLARLQIHHYHQHASNSGKAFSVAGQQQQFCCRGARPPDQQHRNLMVGRPNTRRVFAHQPILSGTTVPRQLGQHQCRVE